MNALQQLIADYMSDHPDETFASIARRGDMPRQTVQALARRSQVRATPRADTIERLSRGMNMSVDVVKAAAGLTAGYGQGTAALEDDKVRLLVEIASGLDAEQMDVLMRRARLLMDEAREAREEREKRNGKRRR